MARIEPIPIREWPPEMRDALAAMTPPEPRHPQAVSEGRPKARNLLGTLAHHPALAKAFFTFNGHLLRATTLTERQRELLVLRVGAKRGARYEWGQHLLLAGDVGIGPDEVRRIEHDPASPEWSPFEAALLRAVDELVDDGVVSDATWAELSGELEAQQLLDVIFTVGAYDTLAGMMRSVDVDIDADLQQVLDDFAMPDRLGPPATVARVLDRALADDPDREALVTRSRRLTYAELDRLADRAAHALVALGVRPGDRVAASLPNDADVVVAFHGAMRLGAVWVGVNRALAPPEKQWLLADCGASLLLSDGPLDDAGVPVVDLATWRAAVDAAPDAPVGVDVDPFAPAGIAYTSGTTGRPKGAVHSQHNLLLPGAVLVETRGYGPDLRKGDCFPFTILNMAVLTTLLVSQAGGTSIVMDRIDAEGVAEWIRAERVTTWNGPPPLLHSLAHMDTISPADLASLDEVWTGGADCPEAIRSAFEAKFGLPVLCSYGLSEAPTVVSIDSRTGADHVPGASGRPLPHLAVRIAGDDDRTLPAGEVGEIRVGAADHRYRPMLGYWERPDATAEALAGGELHTGDIGVLDADGFLHLRDRKSLLILRGGANVYPAEVERVLAEHPAVAAGAVLGVPDERLGERVVAVVESAAGAELDVDDLRAFLLANLAKYKVPERITVVDALPRNAMGKIVRADLPTLVEPGDGRAEG